MRRWRWTLLLPVGLIVISLIALVVVPVVLERRTEPLEMHRNEVAQPARDLVNTVQRSLAQEMGALRGFVITRDEAFLERYEDALETERRAYEELETLMTRMSPEVGAAFRQLRSSASRWHGRVTEAEILRRQLVPEEFIERIPSEELRYEQALDAAETLRERIVAEVEENRRGIEAMQRTSLRVTMLLALLAAGAALGALWLGRRLRILASEAERRRKEAERVGGNRARLIRGITHDLKNPLGGARGHLQLLQSGVVDDPERRRESVDRADRAIGTALEIIDDLIDLSRAEAGEMVLAREPTDLSAVVQETVQEQQGEAEGADVALDVERADGAAVAETDPRRVKEILRNLVSNGLKYTPAGGRVTVRVRGIVDRPPQEDGEESGRRPDQGWCAVEVSDTGPGIPADERDRIFQEFSRLGGADTGAAGAGLGLAISRHIARLLGGDIDVESEMGRGSTFTLWLPATSSEPSGPPDPE